MMMNLQYISDSKGRTTGVSIPISEWNKFKKKYKEIEQEVSNVSAWHKELVEQRIKDFKNNPDSVVDFDKSIGEIEKEH
jgi:hypothetical protein